MGLNASDHSLAFERFEESLLHRFEHVADADKSASVTAVGDFMQSYQLGAVAELIQVLEQGGGTRHQVRISGAGKPDGVYLLRWWNGQGLSGTVRVVKGG